MTLPKIKFLSLLSTIVLLMLICVAPTEAVQDSRSNFSDSLAESIEVSKALDVNEKATQVSAGNYHSCALFESGKVKCWGDNFLGQLGNGLNAGGVVPVDVVGIENATQIDLGALHSCALLSTGSVKCWGWNNSGQLGDGTKIDKNVPTEVTGITDATQISLGDAHSCAVLSSGGIKCWGNNREYQLGDGTIVSRTTPVQVVGINDAIQADLGYVHSCAVLSSGAMKCWGYNGEGQLGDGTTTLRTAPVVVDISDAVQIALGTAHTCAVTSVGSVKCWGRGWLGQLGDGTSNLSSTPVDVVNLNDATQVSLGGHHSCALSASKGAICWGWNEYGQLGDGQTTTSSTVVEVIGGYASSNIGLGRDHTCTIVNDGIVRCWGYNEYSQLGDISYANSAKPVQVKFPFVGDVSVVSLGNSHSCVVLISGDAKCWGRNSLSQVGDSTKVTRLSAVYIKEVADATMVALGDSFSCVLLENKSVKCWGQNNHGQIGVGYSSTEVVTPAVVVGVTDAVSIASGSYHACALISNGTIKCWGYNYEGQLGNNSRSTQLTATDVVGISDAKQIALGGSQSCALLFSGGIKCWGKNSSGQLGDGSGTRQLIAVDVVGVSDAIMVESGDSHSCALLSSGAVKCWGFNSTGQLGDGNTFDRFSPVEVIGITDAVSIDLGGAHSCALLSSGNVKCWGLNNRGQLGDETLTTRLSPVVVAGITDAVSIDLGGAHSCTLLSSGAVKCWGYNEHGSLGDGTTKDRNKAVYVGDVSIPHLSDKSVLTLVDIDSTAISLDWREPFDGGSAITDYLVEYRVSGALTWLTFTDGESTATSATVTGLSPGVSYEFRVGAVNSVGTTYSDSVSVTTDPVAPDAPMVSVGTVSSSSVGLSWTTPFDGGSAIIDYLVEYRVSGALTWLTFADGESTATSATVTGLLPDVSYEFRVGATNSVGTTYSETEIVRTSGFTFVSFAPSYVSKGAAVDVVGTSLSLVTEVRIGTLVVPFRFVSDELLVVTVPTNVTSGALRLISSSQNVSAGTLTVASRRSAKPSITVVEPYVASPGAVLRVQGSNIGAASVVRVAGLDAVFSVTGRNALSLTLPLNANNGKVTITTPGGTATSSGTVVVPPRVTGSLSGGAGVLVSLAGENLADVTSVSLNGVSITPSAKALTSVSFVVPSNAVSGSGYVTGPGGVSSTFTFSVIPAPTLDTFSATVKVGDTVTLSGSNLQGVTKVLIGTVAATTMSSTSTNVTFVVPTGAKTGTVTFTGAAGTVVSSSTLTVLPPPVITKMTPTSGKTGTTVTIIGTGLTGATVTVGTRTATKSTNTATKIKFKIPSGLTKGTYTIKVATTNGETTNTFRVT